MDEDNNVNLDITTPPVGTIKKQKIIFSFQKENNK